MMFHPAETGLPRRPSGSWRKWNEKTPPSSLTHWPNRASWPKILCDTAGLVAMKRFFIPQMQS